MGPQRTGKFRGAFGKAVPGWTDGLLPHGGAASPPQKVFFAMTLGHQLFIDWGFILSGQGHLGSLGSFNVDSDHLPASPKTTPGKAESCSHRLC